MKVLAPVANEKEKKLLVQCNKKYALDLCFCENSFWAGAAPDCGGKFAAVIGPSQRLESETPDFERLSQMGIKYFTLRSTGYDHLNLDNARSCGIRAANVRAYSPNAIADLALSLGLMLLRGTAAACRNSAAGDFHRPSEPAREVRDCTVGILGTGAIGLVVARYYNALGAKVLGFDKYPRQGADMLEYVEFETVIAQSDIISVHLPYIKGETDNIISSEIIGKMKRDAVLVNAARGELLDMSAALDAVEEGRLWGFGSDVFCGEREALNHTISAQTNSQLGRAMGLYPKVLITPHMGAMTNRARINMADIALRNLYEFINSNSCQNEIT